MIDVLPAPHPETKSLIIEVVNLSRVLGLCPHDFLWPRRAADGDYYQVCRLCGVEHKYDWEHMRRKRSHPRPKPASAPPSLRSNRVPDRKTVPPVRLLLEREPAYRVFFGNLADLIRRRTAPMVTPSETAAFWPDVFVTPPVPWPRLLESMLFHTIAITVLVILSQPWVQLDPLPRVVHRSYISYYSPSQTFPALRGSQTLVRKPPRKRREAAQPTAAGTAGQSEAQKADGSEKRGSENHQGSRRKRRRPEGAGRETAKRQAARPCATQYHRLEYHGLERHTRSPTFRHPAVTTDRPGGPYIDCGSAA